MRAKALRSTQQRTTTVFPVDHTVRSVVRLRRMSMLSQRRTWGGPMRAQIWPGRHGSTHAGLQARPGELPALVGMHVLMATGGREQRS